MSSFLLTKKQEQTFEEKISNRSKRTQQIFQTVQKSFNQFCVEFYDSRTSGEIFEELESLNDSEKTDAIHW